MRNRPKSGSVQDHAGDIPRRGRWAAASDDALGLVGAAFARAGFLDPTLILRWQEIAGPDVARIAEPSRYAEGPEGATLTLRCPPGAALFLQHQTRALVERLNLYLGPGRIAHLRFAPGRITGEITPESDQSAAPPQPPVCPAENLAEALQNLARRRKAAAIRPRSGNDN